MCLVIVFDKSKIKNLRKVRAFKAFDLYFDKKLGATTLVNHVQPINTARYLVGETYQDRKHFLPYFPRLAKWWTRFESQLAGEHDNKSYPRGFHAYENIGDLGTSAAVAEVELDNIVAVGKQEYDDIGPAYVALTMKIVRLIPREEYIELRNKARAGMWK